MLIIVVALLAIIFFVVWIVAEAAWIKTDAKWQDAIEVIGIINMVLFGISAIVLANMIAWAVSENICQEQMIAKHESTREVLVYQLENHTYENDNSLGANELFDDVRLFNSEINKSRAGRESIWPHPFYGSWCESVDPIDLSEY